MKDDFGFSEMVLYIGIILAVGFVHKFVELGRQTAVEAAGGTCEDLGKIEETTEGGIKYWISTTRCGDVVWMNDSGKYDRIAGPAVTKKDGTMEYYKNGVLHNSFGNPAVLSGFGNKYWYKDGKLHNVNGPALIEGSDTLYYLEGKKVTREEVMYK